MGAREAPREGVVDGRHYRDVGVKFGGQLRQLGRRYLPLEGRLAVLLLVAEALLLELVEALGHTVGLELGLELGGLLGLLDLGDADVRGDHGALQLHLARLERGDLGDDDRDLPGVLLGDLEVGGRHVREAGEDRGDVVRHRLADLGDVRLALLAQRRNLLRAEHLAEERPARHLEARAGSGGGRRLEGALREGDLHLLGEAGVHLLPLHESGALIAIDVVVEGLPKPFAKVGRQFPGRQRRWSTGREPSGVRGLATRWVGDRVGW